MSNNQLRAREKGGDHERMRDEEDDFKIEHKGAMELNQRMRESKVKKGNISLFYLHFVFVCQLPACFSHYFSEPFFLLLHHFYHYRDNEKQRHSPRSSFCLRRSLSGTET